MAPKPTSPIVWAIFGGLLANYSAGLALAQENPAWAAQKDDFQVISADPFYGNNDLWVLIARRVPDENALARRITGKYEQQVNEELPRINRRVNRLVYEAEARVNGQYNRAERQLQKNVRQAAGSDPSDAVTALEYDTIPQAINEVNQAVFDAQQDINQNVRRTQKAVTKTILKAEAAANRAIPKSGPVVTDGVKRIVDRAEEKVDQRLFESGRQINEVINRGNKVVDANIAKVVGQASVLLPAAAAKKVASDIKTASGEIDDSIATAKRNVVQEVLLSTTKLKQIVPALKDELRAAKRK